MALNRRQKRFYTENVNLYAPVWPGLGANNEAGDASYVQENIDPVRCHWEAKAESSLPEAPGRSNQDMMITTDVFHFSIDVEIGDQWFIELLAPHPEAGAWFCVQGAPNTKAWKANKLSVLAKKSLSPFV